MSSKSQAHNSAQDQAATLTVLEGRAKGTVFPLYQERITIGRISTANLVLDDATVSRMHACIELDSDHYYITDTSSRWGIEINGSKISERSKLCDGDLIRIGRFVFRYEAAKAHC